MNLQMTYDLRNAETKALPASATVYFVMAVSW
jgi:hypothetical protein